MSTVATRAAPAAVRSPALVLGGGLAGIAAALRLAEAGVGVTLVETRRRLGGRATSFIDPASGRVLDNCQHVLLGCCTNLVDLYQRLGVSDRIDWHRCLHFQDGRGVRDRLQAGRLPAPLHLTVALLRFGSLSPAEKLAICRGMFAILRLGARGRDRWRGRTFACWLRARAQPAGAVQKFWSGIVTGAVNERPDRVDAAVALQVFQEGFLHHREAHVLGLPGMPLGQVYDGARQALISRGGRLRLATTVEALRHADGRIEAVRLADGESLKADVYVSALPFDRLGRICDAQLMAVEPRLRCLGEFGVSPIIGIHLWLEQRVLDLPHLILTQSPLHWIFNKGWDADAGGQHLHGVISAAHELVDASTEQLADMTAQEIIKALPAARGLRIVHRRVVKERRATFSAGPGVEALRLTTRVAVPNLYLAGDWCRTGWPATMEGAVRSGYAAAAAALVDLGRDAPPAVPDLPVAALCRLVGSGRIGWQVADGG